MTEEKPAEKKAEAKPAAKPAEKKAVTKTPEKTDAIKPDAKQPDAKKPDTKKPAEDSKYQPLANVRAEIWQILAAEKQLAGYKAYGEVDASLLPIREAVNKYRLALSQYRIDSGEKENVVKPKAPDFDALAKQNGLTFHKTSLISAAEMADLDIGKSVLHNNQQYFLTFVYGNSNLNRPLLTVDGFRNKYIFWKTDSSKDKVPKFEDKGIRKQVLAATPMPSTSRL